MVRRLRMRIFVLKNDVLRIDRHVLRSHREFQKLVNDGGEKAGKKILNVTDVGCVVLVEGMNFSVLDHAFLFRFILRDFTPEESGSVCFNCLRRYFVETDNVRLKLLYFTMAAKNSFPLREFFLVISHVIDVVIVHREYVVLSFPVFVGKIEAEKGDLNELEEIELKRGRGTCHS